MLYYKRILYLGENEVTQLRANTFAALQSSLQSPEHLAKFGLSKDTVSQVLTQYQHRLTNLQTQQRHTFEQNLAGNDSKQNNHHPDVTKNHDNKVGVSTKPRPKSTKPSSSSNTETETDNAKKAANLQIEVQDMNRELNMMRRTLAKQTVDINTHLDTINFMKRSEQTLRYIHI